MKTMKKGMIPAVIVASLAVAHAANAPEMKEGLWSVHTTVISGSAKNEGSFTLCRSHAFGESVENREKDVLKCNVLRETHEAGKYSSETHCTAGGIAIDTKETITFQGDTEFHSEAHSTTTTSTGSPTEMTMIHDQKYLGSCPAGVQPGDRVNADGTVIHLGKP